MKRIFCIVSIIMVVFWLPFFVVHITTQSEIQTSFDAIPASDAIIIFGAVVRDGEISPLQKERLDTGKVLFFANKGDEIVVSNTASAAEAMALYLDKEGVPVDAITIDPTAEKTPDTCRFEKYSHPEGRTRIFVSQGYHLPRLLYQCKKVGVNGVAIPAEKFAKDRSQEYSFGTRVVIRSKRYIREAGLMWLAVLHIYK